MHACAEPCCADSPDSPTFAKPCRADSPDSPTFAEPCCADSPNSPTFAKPLTEYSPDSPTFAKGIRIRIRIRIRHIRTSNSPFWRIWGEWPLLIFTPFFLLLSQKSSLCTCSDIYHFIDFVYGNLVTPVLNGFQSVATNELKTHRSFFLKHKNPFFI
jgi:hypothetical protein